MRVVDFFCGCGGASEGFRQAGFEIALGLDFEPKAAATYRANFPEAEFIEGDIVDVSTDVVRAIVEQDCTQPLLLTACAPCQPFSNQNKTKFTRDSRRTLLDETHRFVRDLLPEYIVLENVPGMQRVDKKRYGPFARFLKLLEDLGYEYIFFVAKANEYGVPQKRKRLVLLASSLGCLSAPEKTHGEGLLPYVTVRDAIADYPRLNADDQCELDPIHRSARMNKLNITRIKHTPEGGDRRDWPKRLVNDCHKNYTGHTDTYGRLTWDLPAPTLTTKCNSYSNGRFGHPDVTQHRALSIREAASLQTFPPTYQFEGTMGYMARQVGNAVPCELARQFGLSLAAHFEQVRDGHEQWQE